MCYAAPGHIQAHSVRVKKGPFAREDTAVVAQMCKIHRLPAILVHRADCPCRLL